MEMAFAMVVPIASQSMIAIPLREGVVLGEERNRAGDKRIKFAPVSTSFFALEVAPESGRELNPPHSSRSSTQKRY